VQAPSADGEGPAAPADDAEPWWRRFELVWPLSIVAGFAGTWLGLRTGLPGVATVLALAAFVPLYLAEMRAGQRFHAALLGALWSLGIIGAAVGEALQRPPAEVLAGFAGGAPFVQAELAFRDGGPVLATLSRNALIVGGLFVLARPAWGLVSLAGSGVLAGLLGSVALTCAGEAVQGGLAPSLAALAGIPPHLFLALVGVQLGLAALAEPGLVAREPFTDLRRALLWSAVGLAGLGLGLQGLWIRAWQEWLGG